MRVLFVCLLFSGLSHGQQSFVKQYFEGHAKAVKSTQDNGYILCGVRYLASNTNSFIIKTNSIGDSLWTHTFTQSTNNTLFDVIELTNGSFMASGYANSSGDLWLVKLNGLGQVLWTKTGPYRWGQSLFEDSIGDIIIAGSELQKLDSNGIVKWKQDLQSTFPSQAMYLLEDNGYVIAGPYYSGNNVIVGTLIEKFDTAGTSLWHHYYSHIQFQNSSNNCLLKAADGSYLLAGREYSWGNAALFHVDSIGDSLWSRTYPDLKLAHALVENQSGYVLTGSTHGYSTFLLQVDSLGNEICKDSLNAGFETKSFPKSLCLDKNGYVMAGGMKAANSNYKVSLVRSDTTCVLYNVSIVEPELKKDFKVFPNPFIESITIQSPNSTDYFQLVIYSVNGIEYYLESLKGQNELDLSWLPKGAYILRCKSEHTISTQILIKAD